MSEVDKILELILESTKEKVDVKTQIQRAKKLSKEMKEKVYPYLKDSSRYNDGKVFGLKLDSEIRKKGTKTGFDMGIDNNGFFVHTHRARSKSYSEPSKIPKKDLKFIDSTG